MSEKVEASKGSCSGPSPGKGPRGVDCIRQYLQSIDGSPGVYRMLGEKGNVLYVGKARNLRNRVQTYCTTAGHSKRIVRMIDATASMMFLTTHTETEALLLEQNLIKQLKPRYNVLLRDDKSFPNILVSHAHSFPQIKKHRGTRKEKGNYYGPFASAGAVNRTLNQLQKAFQLRNCSDNTFENRTRPCLLYQIKRCTAPCVGFISEGDYAVSVRDAEGFLSGASTRLQEQLASEMKAAAGELDFELAAVLRDRIQALTQVQSVQGINPRTVPEADVIGLHMKGGQACVQVFFIRANQNWGNYAYFPLTGSGAEADEVMSTFIGQFYRRKTPPRALILSHGVADQDLYEEALSSQLGRKVRIKVPIRGEKAVLVENAVRNAKESLARKLSETATQLRLLRGLSERLGLDEPPERIEVYDNSHIQGSDAVGAMIAAGQEGFLKSSYRKFNFKRDDLTPGDDYGMMREVLSRRFGRLMKEDPGRDAGNWPDLVIVDGGVGQVSAARETMEELGVSGVTIFGVAKGEQRNAGREVFHRADGRSFVLDPADPVLYFVQRIRDEAHRFAIGAHRSKRTKSIAATPLTEIPGVGAARKRALLTHFGSSKAVSRAGLEDLKAVNGISNALAEAIYEFFHARN